MQSTFHCSDWSKNMTDILIFSTSLLHFLNNVSAVDFFFYYRVIKKHLIWVILAFSKMTFYLQFHKNKNVSDNTLRGKKNHNKLLKNFHPKSLKITDNNNNSCCHKEFKELNCTQWSASVTIFGTVWKQMNCDRIWLDSNKTKSGYLLVTIITLHFLSCLSRNRC